MLYLCDTIECLREKSQEHLGATWRTVRMLAPVSVPMPGATVVTQTRHVWQPRQGDDYWITEGRNAAP